MVIGLSRGGGIAVDFALSYPNMVDGLLICAGGIGGLDIPNTSAEDSIFDQLEVYLSKHDAGNATRMVRMLERRELPSPCSM